MTKKITKKPATAKKKAAHPTVKKAPTKKKVKAKKPAPKKFAAKRVSKKVSKRILVEASTERCFWVHEGPVLRNLIELERALGKMSVLQFMYHAPEGRNDFADWVLYVLLDDDCASALRLARTKEQARKIIKQCLKEYK